MIGINEMGTGDVDYFMEHYEAAVARIRQLQPDAIIYLQGSMHVTNERSAEGDYINNEGIIARNERIAQLADNKTVFYLDVNSVVCDESGGLNPAYTFDGVHLYAQYIHIWTEYLMEHAIEVK
jgi:lysophospholipase L1-like esterase